MRSLHHRHRCAWVAIACLVSAACSGQLTDQEILAANGVRAGSTVPGSAVARPSGSAGATVDTPGLTPTTGVSTGGATAADGATSADGATAAACVTTETGPIVIGSVGTYSGPAGSSLAGLPRGVQLWAANVNAHGGLCGREVQVIVQDDGGDPARYGSLVRDLVENRHVVAFVSPGAFLTMDGGASYLESKGVPVIGNDCARAAWFESPIYFPQCTDFTTGVVSIIRAGVRLTGNTHFGYVFCMEADTCTSMDPILQQGAAQAGAQLVYRAQISITQVDFTANCQNAQKAGVDLMFVGGDANTLARFAQSCDRQDFHPAYTSISTAVAADTVNLPGLSTVVLTNSVFPFEGVSGGPFDEYHNALRQFSRDKSGPANSQGWAGGKLFELAARRAAQATGAINSKSLVDAMRTVKDETLGGLTTALTFTGSTPTPAQCMFAMRGDGHGGWTAPEGAKPSCQ